MEILFRPTGPVEPISPVEDGDGRLYGFNPPRADLVQRARESRTAKQEQFVARAIVGRNVGATRNVWTLDNVKAVAFNLREELGLDPSMSLFAGEGVYKSDDGTKLVAEKSVQIVIFDFTKDWDTFAENSVNFCWNLARRLLQHSVLLQLTDRGIQHFGDFVYSDLPEAMLQIEGNEDYVAEIETETREFLKRFS